MDPRRDRSERIRRKALELGFDACGFVPVLPAPEEERRRLLEWLMEGRHAGMEYMARNTDLRLDPARLVPGSKSIVVALLNYAPRHDPYEGRAVPRLSRYAWGRDYHKVMRGKLKTLLSWIDREIAPVRGRVFVDSAPLLERSLAQRAGLGWIGRNGLLITRKGSWFFIGELVIDMELAYDHQEVKDRCGTCTRCVEACPTQAILPGRTLDARRCISYWTVEYKGEHFPDETPQHFSGYAFGCDICQEVCPWNRRAEPHHTPDFDPDERRMSLTHEEWYKMDEETFHDLFAGTPLMRTGLQGMKRNVERSGG